MKNCTLFIASCDKYYQAWEPFFFFLKKHWKNFDMPIILNTETKQYEYDGFDIKTFSFYKENEEVPWGKRMLDHLEKVETDYVIWMLEDFFIRRDVDEQEIQKLIEICDKDKSISTFNLCHAPIKFEKKGKILNYELRHKRGRYKFATTGLWRVSHLKKYILAQDTPWKWETDANYRSLFTSNKFYMLAEGCNSPLEYGFTYDWMGIRRGKWVIEDVGPLFKENGLEVNFDDLGVWYRPQKKTDSKPECIRKRISKVTKKFDPTKAIKTIRKYLKARQEVRNIKDF